jgi:hypothetical protein
MDRRRFLGTAILGSAAGAISGLPGRLSAAPALESRDAYIRSEEGRWVIGTSTVEKVVRLENGRLTLASFMNKVSGRECIQGGAVSNEVRLSGDGQEITGGSGGWVLLEEDSHRLSQGELQLDLKLRHGPWVVTKHYIAYPGCSVIREWLSISNDSTKPVTLRNPAFLESRVLSADVENLELYYMTGGGAFNGAQLLKKEKMSATYARIFDSYDPSDTGPRGMSYSAHLPLLVLQNTHVRDGIMAGWDYLGHWTVKVGNHGGGPVNLSIQVAGYTRELEPGQSIDTPKAFTGVFCGDLDTMGNLLLDWQYEYLWDLTNPDYFGKTRWAVDWPSPWVGAGGTPSADNWGRRLALDLRYVDLLRETGGDILWDDAGWYDKWGSWNSPEWRLTQEYLAKHGMKWVLWYPTFLATPDSALGQQHPEWLIPKQDALEQSIQATADWQRQILDRSVETWGDFQWRYDIAPAASQTDTGSFDADHNFRGLLEGFKRAHNASGVDACFGGGRWISYDLARLADSGEYTDGGVGPYSSYYTSLLVPPDKYHNVVDFDHTYYNPASDRIHLCLDPCWYRDPGDGPDLEAIRKDWEIYHYFVAQGVAGRWSHVFRPAVENDAAVWYFQRMDRTNSKGVIIAKHAKLGPTYYLLCKPKERAASDFYYGDRGFMCKLATTEVARADSGIYEDLVDHEYRYYGVPGEAYGPLNFKYVTAGGPKSYITSIEKLGGRRPVKEKFFGMAIQTGMEPIRITHLGEYAQGNAAGVYTLMVVRAEDGVVLASVDLDTSKGFADAMGFKYAALSTPLQLDPAPGKPVVVKPRGLHPEMFYDIRCAKSSYQASRLGGALMQSGIELGPVLPGELIFLNLPNYPGSRTGKTPPSPPQQVTKRLGTNLGVQGVEIAWKGGAGNHWVSYYEILKNGALVAKAAIGSFFFDYKGNSTQNLEARYEVRTVDGDGNRSPMVVAESIAGDPETYTALGGFSPTQGANQWKYEEAFGDTAFREMRWEGGGYEGRWVGSGMATIGRMWMQPGAQSDVSRTLVAPANAALTVSGSIRKDPSAENGHTIKACILHNDRRIWPANGWAEILPDFSKTVECRVEDLHVAQGDSVRFVLQHSGHLAPEAVIWNPTVIVSRPG